jgi:hypothetical protein
MAKPEGLVESHMHAEREGRQALEEGAGMRMPETECPVESARLKVHRDDRT